MPDNAINEPPRDILFVGSIPVTSPEAAIALELETSGQYLDTIGDGETHRLNWVAEIINDKLSNHPDLEVIQKLDGVAVVGVREGRELTSESLRPYLSYAAHAQEGIATLQRLESRYPHREGLAYQVGIPSPFDLSLAAFGGPQEGAKHVETFRQATLAEIRQAKQNADAANRPIVFQFEMPVELTITAMTPPESMAEVAEQMATNILSMVSELDPGVRFGVHLCVGDRGHKANIHMATLAPLVLLANAVAKGWPAGHRPLEYLHIPLASGEQAAPLAKEYYASLAQLELPHETRLIAGLVHEDQSLEDLRRVLAWVEGAVGHRTGVAAACGLGRRNLDVALAVIHNTVTLAESK
jgi:hypothetical protein